jgi:N-acetylmuramoyl-L-alanine amidase
MRPITHLVIHCTATKEGQAIHVPDIDRWHKAKGWNGIGYHYVINLDGGIELGRPLSEVGAHVEGHNATTVGIVYVGGLDKNLSPKDTRNEKQKKALLESLKSLKRQFPTAKIVGHRDFSPDLNKNGIIEPSEFIKACPCFDVKNEYKSL